MSDDHEDSELRRLVADVVREVAAEAAEVALFAEAREEQVWIADDHDLRAFARRLLEDPRAGIDVEEGRLRFGLDPKLGHRQGYQTSGARRVEAGAVTERQVTAAAAAGLRIVLGPRAVLTPLARDKARALGVDVEKERP